MTIRNTRQSAAFPTAAILRKGGPKVKKDGKEVMGPDLSDRFRVDWLPGVDPAVMKMFEDIYHTDQPHNLCTWIVEEDEKVGMAQASFVVWADTVIAVDSL